MDKIWTKKQQPLLWFMRSSRTWQRTIQKFIKASSGMIFHLSLLWLWHLVSLVQVRFGCGRASWKTWCPGSNLPIVLRRPLQQQQFEKRTTAKSPQGFQRIWPNGIPGSPSRLFVQWFFRKDYCFSKGLLSTNPGTCHFMVFDFQGNNISPT